MIGSDPEVDMREIAAAIQEDSTNSSEALFQWRYRRPIFLAVAIALFNQLSGINAILYYPNDVFAAAGFNCMSGNLQAVAVGCMDLAATLIAMQLIDKIGRRTLLLAGSAGMTVSLGAVATVFGGSHRGLLLPFLVTYIFFFAISQGSVIWVYLCEVFPTRVRGKGQGLGCTVH